MGDLSKIFFKKNFFFLRCKQLINHTFYAELNKKLQIYGLISTSPIDGIKTTNLIRPESSLKFWVVHNRYMDHIVLQLEDIRKPRKIETRKQRTQRFFNFINRS